jgi:hypothetical protein
MWGEQEEEDQLQNSLDARVHAHSSLSHRHLMITYALNPSRRARAHVLTYTTPNDHLNSPRRAHDARRTTHYLPAPTNTHTFPVAFPSCVAVGAQRIAGSRHLAVVTVIEPSTAMRRVLLQALTHPLAANREMCIVNSQGSPPASQAEWDAVFAGLESRERQMRELLR